MLHHFHTKSKAGIMADNRDQVTNEKARIALSEVENLLKYGRYPRVLVGICMQIVTRKLVTNLPLGDKPPHYDLIADRTRPHLQVVQCMKLPHRSNH